MRNFERGRAVLINSVFAILFPLFITGCPKASTDGTGSTSSGTGSGTSSKGVGTDKVSAASNAVSPSATPSPSPTPSASPSPSPSPSASPTPSPSPWVGTPGALGGGSWQAPATDPDAGHAGAYGGINYAPNGDLYLFYQTGAAPNETLKNVIRRNGSSSWSAEYFVGGRERSANVYFTAGGKPYVSTESGGSTNIYTSVDYTNNFPQSVTWSSQAYFQANDGNPDFLGANSNAFLTFDGNNYNLLYTYLYYNPVTGGESWGAQIVSQSAGNWPASGFEGAAFDGSNHPIYATNPHGMSGAFQDNHGNILALSSQAYRSTDYGSTFTQVMGGGLKSDSLNGVSGSVLNPTDNSIVLGNLYNNGGGWNLAVWGTRDYGANFSKITDIAAGGNAYRVKVASVQNLVVVVWTIDGGAGESMAYYIRSYDGGATWTGSSQLVDATAGGHPSYTFGSVNLTANPSTGTIAFAYSLLNGAVHKGVYLKEFH